MTVEVGSEIEQLVFKIRARPEQRVIQILVSKSADQPLHEWMGQRNVGDGLDFGYLQYPQIGLPLVEPIKRIMVGAEVFGHRAVPSNGAVEHPAESDTIDRSDLDAEPNDTARILIHDNQDPVGPQRSRFAPEQIDTPEAVLQVAQESQPGWTTGVLFRAVVTGETPSNLCQGHLLSNSWTAPGGLRCFIWTTASISSWLGPFGPGLRLRLDEKSRRYFRVPQGLVEAQQSRRFQYDC